MNLATTWGRTMSNEKIIATTFFK